MNGILMQSLWWCPSSRGRYSTTIWVRVCSGLLASQFPHPGLIIMYGSPLITCFQIRPYNPWTASVCINRVGQSSGSLPMCIIWYIKPERTFDYISKHREESWIAPKVLFAIKMHDSSLAIYRIRIPDCTNSQVKIDKNYNNGSYLWQ